MRMTDRRYVFGDPEKVWCRIRINRVGPAGALAGISVCPIGGRFKACLACNAPNRLTWRVCRGCSRPLVTKPRAGAPPTQKPTGAALDALKRDQQRARDEANLKKAQAGVDAAITRLGRTMTSLKMWRDRVKYYSKVLADGRKKAKPRAPKPVRAIRR